MKYWKSTQLYCFWALAILGLITFRADAQGKFNGNIAVDSVQQAVLPEDLLLVGTSANVPVVVVVKKSTVNDIAAQRFIEQMATQELKSAALYISGRLLNDPAQQQGLVPPNLLIPGTNVLEAKTIFSSEGVSGLIQKAGRKSVVLRVPRVKGGQVRGFLKQRLKLAKGANRKKCKRGAVFSARGRRKNTKNFQAFSVSCFKAGRKREALSVVPAPGQVPLAVDLVDVRSKKKILPLSDGAVINLRQTGRSLTIQASSIGTVRSVVFQLSGPQAHIFSTDGPYILNGASGDRLQSFQFVPGNYILEVKGFSGKNGTGHIMAQQRVSFVVESGSEEDRQELGVAEFNQFLPDVVSSKPEIFVGEFETQEGCDVQGGFGTAVLVLNRKDQLAGLKLSYQGLTDLVAHHVHAENDTVLWSLDDTELYGDTYVWRISETGGFNVSQILRSLDRGKLYVDLHSSKCPKGELKADFKQVDTPNLIVPSGESELARFLNQSTFGATRESISILQNQGVDAYLNAQLNVPLDQRCYLTPRVAQGREAGNAIDSQDIVVSSWWDCALNSPQDEICHRVAFALSQQWVVSGARRETSEAEALAHYYDVLKRHCFGNLRELMEEITLSAPMGVFLDMMNNSAAGPNENFAREIMQLFTIGKDLLRSDGTPQIDEDTRSPIPTYQLEDVAGLSKVFTGWTWGNTEFGAPLGSWEIPMKPIDAVHDTSTKTIFAGGGLGKGGTPKSNLRDALDQLFNHPSFCPFNARRLIQQFVTSNPSPEYVARVSAECENNGFGVRGDLRRMVYVTLLDKEARDSEFADKREFGKLRQPYLILAHMMKLLRVGDVYPSGCFIRDWHAIFAQTPMHAPSVFSFFEPDYSNPGVISSARLVSPEFQTLNQTSLISRLNYLWGAVDQGAFKCARDGLIYELPFDIGPLAEMTSDELATYLDVMFTGGAFERSNRLVQLIAALSSTEVGDAQARLGLKAVISSSKHMIQK